VKVGPNAFGAKRLTTLGAVKLLMQATLGYQSDGRLQAQQQAF